MADQTKLLKSFSDLTLRMEKTLEILKNDRLRPEAKIEACRACVNAVWECEVQLAALMLK
jgi:hypothetical protein